jgi:predicted transposase/invertase (TIGR01784 family)
MSGDHDLGYKQLFAHPELVRDLIAGFTGLACFRGLGPDAFERVNASFVSERFSERHGDMVWKVRLNDHVIYVYLLLEFQSQAERWMALRVQVYVGLLYQDLVKRHELASARLPPVLPVVFYNGRVPWNASEELRHLVAAGPEELDGFQASQRYLVIDQHSIDPADLTASRNLVAALFRLELSDSPRVLMDVIATLRVWLAGDEQAPIRRSIAKWIERLRQHELPQLEAPNIQALLEDETMGERFERKYATWADALEDEGRQKGREEGREEGKLLATRSVLTRLLAGRFGALAPAATARIEAAPQEQLERWIDSVFGAASLDEVFSR